jgi:hypothetical protein
MALNQARSVECKSYEATVNGEGYANERQVTSRLRFVWGLYCVCGGCRVRRVREFADARADAVFEGEAQIGGGGPGLLPAGGIVAVDDAAV